MVGQQQAHGALAVHNIATSRRCRSSDDDPGAVEAGDRARVRRHARARALEICGLRGRNRRRCEKAISGTVDGQNTIDALRALFTALATIDAPKTMILVSEGFIVDDSRGLIIELGALAAAARTSIYALKLDDAARSCDRRASARADRRRSDDRQAQAEGLELLAGASRGALFNVTGTGAGVFDRIESELSGYYLLGVESDARGQGRQAAPDPRRGAAQGRSPCGRARQLVNRGRATGRRRERPASRSRPRAATRRCCRRRCRCASPTFALQGPERDKVQLLIHADVGTDYPASKVVVARLRHHRSRAAGCVDSQIGEHAAAAGDERRAVGAAVHGRRQPAARRLHAEARRRRRRSRRHGRAHEFTPALPARRRSARSAS